MGYLCVTELWDQCSAGDANVQLTTEAFSFRFLHYESFIAYIVLRAVVFAAGEAMAGYLSRRQEAKARGGQARLVALVVIYATLIVGFVVLVWSFTYTILERSLGMRPSLFDEPEMCAANCAPHSAPHEPQTAPGPGVMRCLMYVLGGE